MLTFIGILFILVGTVAIVWARIKKQLDENDVLVVGRGGRPKNMVSFPIPLKPGYWFLIGFIIISLNGMFFWANAGTAYAVQYPWGGDKMVRTQGIKVKVWGRVIPLSYEISIQDIILKKTADENGNIIEKDELPESADGIYNREAKQWEFADAIKADIATAIVVGVAVEDENVFLNMADRNRSEAKLIYGRVLPNIDAALKNTCKLMDAQEYISGKASDFDRYFRDQLENGMYVVEEYEQQEDVSEVIGDTGTIRVIKPVASNKGSKQKRYRIKKDSQGNVIRDDKSNTLKQYGIKIYQAQVTAIDWENSFDDRLQLQKEQVAQTQLEKQEAEKEYYRAKKEIAKGESEKAAERATLEKQQIKETVQAETRAKVAEQDLIAERKKFEVAQYQAKSMKILAEAESYKNAKLVQAGLTPQEKMEMDIKIADLVSKNLAAMNVPSNVIIGGDSKGANSTEALLQVKLMNDIIGNKKN